jgi:hypothetical protein
MASGFPNAIDDFTDPLSTSPLNSPSHSALHADVNDAITKIEQFVPRRNVLYNGAMQVHQRGITQGSITTGGYYTADRWYQSVGTMGTWTQTVETGVAGTDDNVLRAGFRKFLKVNCNTADASPAAGDFHQFFQALEGQDLQAFRKGTTSAQQFTISFWVKTNVTGTYVLNLVDNDNNRSVSATYTVSASGTWEFKTVTLPADSTGLFDNDNNASLYVVWWLGAGSTYSSGTLNTTWASTTQANRAVGQVNVAAAINNYWQVTGLQLNVGGVAAPFEFKSYPTELAECQRYYWKWVSAADGDVYVASYIPSGGRMNYTVPIPTQMRVRPTTATLSGSWQPVNSTTNISVDNRGVNWIILKGDSAVSASFASGFYSLNGSSTLVAEAEL